MHSEHAARLASLSYRLRGLGMGGAVLHVGAHPDDEDVGLLSYLTGKFGVRAVYWSATRGEGGQNRLNAYRDEALGIYRTWESLAARAVDGGECLFGPFYNSGTARMPRRRSSSGDERPSSGRSSGRFDSFNRTSSSPDGRARPMTSTAITRR